MIKSAIPTRVHGVTVPIFLFCVTVWSMIATTIVGAVLQSFDHGVIDPKTFSWVILGNTALPSLLATVLFAISGCRFASYKR